MLKFVPIECQVRLSSNSVTGPSLTSSTDIRAWNTPVSTRKPISRIAVTVAS